MPESSCRSRAAAEQREKPNVPPNDIFGSAVQFSISPVSVLGCMLGVFAAALALVTELDPAGSADMTLVTDSGDQASETG